MSGGGVGGGDIREDGDVIDPSFSAAIEGDDGFFEWGLGSCEVEVGDGARCGGAFCKCGDEFCGLTGFGGDDDLTALDDFSGGEGDFFTIDLGDGAVESDGVRREAVGKLLGDGLHAGGGEGGASFRKHAEGELEHFTGGAELVLEEDAAVEGAEEGVYHAGAEAECGEVGCGGLIGGFAGSVENFKAEEGDAEFVGEGADGGEGAGEEGGGTAEDVHDAVVFLSIEYEGSGLEGFEIEGGEVEEFSGLGVGAEVDLEATV